MRRSTAACRCRRHLGGLTLRQLRCRGVHGRFQVLVDAYPKLGASTTEDVRHWSLGVERAVLDVLGPGSDAYGIVQEVQQLRLVVDASPRRIRRRGYRLAGSGEGRRAGCLGERRSDDLTVFPERVPVCLLASSRHHRRFTTEALVRHTRFGVLDRHRPAIALGCDRGMVCACARLGSRACGTTRDLRGCSRHAGARGTCAPPRRRHDVRR